MTPTKETRSPETNPHIAAGRPPAELARQVDDRVRQVQLGGVWALPACALRLALSTTTHQPGAVTDLPGYADFVTTTPFPTSYIGASTERSG